MLISCVNCPVIEKSLELRKTIKIYKKIKDLRIKISVKISSKVAINVGEAIKRKKRSKNVPLLLLKQNLIKKTI